jgi:hypothetical protein
VVVLAGETVIPAVFAALLQVYDVPPLAVSVVFTPKHIVVEAGDIATTGIEFTVMEEEAEAVQVLASVTVTV